MDEMAPTPSSGNQLTQQPTVNPTGFVSGQGTNTLAAAALIFGIGAYLVCPVVGAIVAVICGHMARRQINRSGEGGKGMATAGLVLGYIQLVVIVGGFLVEVALLVVPPRV
jgi:MFS family permease